MFLTPNRDELEDMLDRAEAAASSDWERDFVADMREKFEADPYWEPSERQADKLDEIAAQ